MPCIDLAMPPDHNMVLNEAVEVPSWMSTSFGQDLGCSLSYVDRLMVPPNRNKKLKKVRVLVFWGGGFGVSHGKVRGGHGDGSWRSSLSLFRVLRVGWVFRR